MATSKLFKVELTHSYWLLLLLQLLTLSVYTYREKEAGEREIVWGVCLSNAIFDEKGYRQFTRKKIEVQRWELLAMIRSRLKNEWFNSVIIYLTIKVFLHLINYISIRQKTQNTSKLNKIKCNTLTWTGEKNPKTGFKKKLLRVNFKKLWILWTFSFLFEVYNF